MKLRLEQALDEIGRKFANQILVAVRAEILMAFAKVLGVGDRPAPKPTRKPAKKRRRPARPAKKPVKKATKKMTAAKPAPVSSVEASVAPMQAETASQAVAVQERHSDLAQPVEKLGLTRSRTRLLRAAGIHCVGKVAVLDEEMFQVIFRHGELGLVKRALQRLRLWLYMPAEAIYGWEPADKRAWYPPKSGAKSQK